VFLGQPIYVPLHITEHSWPTRVLGTWRARYVFPSQVSQTSTMLMRRPQNGCSVNFSTALFPSNRQFSKTSGRLGQALYEPPPHSKLLREPFNRSIALLPSNRQCSYSGPREEPFFFLPSVLLSNNPQIQTNKQGSLVNFSIGLIHTPKKREKVHIQPSRTFGLAYPKCTA
jgi:hypothetical protein